MENQFLKNEEFSKLLDRPVLDVPYQEAREHLFRPAAGVYWSGAGLVPDAIKYITGYGLTHASTLLWEDMSGRWEIIEADESEGEPFKGCVRRVYLSEKIKRYQGDCILIPLSGDIQPYAEDIMIEHLLLEGYPYDYKDLVRQVWRKVKVDQSELFCSELQQIAMRRGIPASRIACLPRADDGLMNKFYRQIRALVPGEMANLTLFQREAYRLVIEKRDDSHRGAENTEKKP